MMNPRLATMASLCREAAIPAAVFALVAFGYANVGSTGTAPIVDRLAPGLAADVTLADKPLPNVASTIAITTARASIPEAGKPEPARDPEPVVTAVLDDSSKPRDLPQDHVAQTKMASLEPNDVGPVAGSADALSECVDACIDRYLWALYERTPKEDAIKTEERRKVTVKKRGKAVTVTRTFTTLTDEDFSWKDPKAAEHAGMSMADYVIGGVDRDFKLKLYRLLHAAEEAGLSPGITSAFRDDYRQSIASGLKAADNRSYHGGSLRGGYGHGLAADIVSVNGSTRDQRLSSSRMLWNWVDGHGKEFGIGRPYLDRDPPHVAPIDGKEYADHHPGMHARQAKAGNRAASRDDHNAAKHARTARSSRVRTI